MDSTAKKETQAALKLLNQYADSYKILEAENKSLKSQIKDLHSNILINKEIITSLLSKTKMNKASASVVSKLQEENTLISNQNSSLSKQMSILQSQLSLLTQSLSALREESDYSKDKIFVLEQAMAKKDNMMMLLSKKKKPSVNQEQILIIQEPTKALVNLNDELLTYKGLYEKLIYYLKSTRDNMLRYEEIISELQNENGKLKTQNKIQTLSANRERENLLSALRESTSPNSIMTDYKVKPSNQRSNSQFIRHQMLQNHNNFEKQIKQKLKIDEKDIAASGDNRLENDEFTEILKMAGISIEAYVVYSKNKLFSKVIDAIEFMFKLVLDKNMTINLLETENHSLNQKNCQLNKENMELLNDVKRNKKEMSDSMINNMSQITINNLNINSLSAYQKVLEDNRRRREEEQGIRQESKGMNNKENEDMFALESITSSQFQNDFKSNLNENETTNKELELNIPSFASNYEQSKMSVDIQNSM